MKSNFEKTLYESIEQALSDPNKLEISQLANSVANKLALKPSSVRIRIYRLLNGPPPKAKKSQEKQVKEKKKTKQPPKNMQKAIFALLEQKFANDAVTKFEKILGKTSLPPSKRLRNAILNILGWTNKMTLDDDSLWARELNCKTYECYTNAKHSALIHICKPLNNFLKADETTSMFLNPDDQIKFRITPDDTIGPAKFILLFLMSIGSAQRNLFKQKCTTNGIKKSFIKGIFRQIESYACLQPNILKLPKKSQKNPKASKIYLLIR